VDDNHWDSRMQATRINNVLNVQVAHFQMYKIPHADNAREDMFALEDPTRKHQLHINFIKVLFAQKGIIVPITLRNQYHARLANIILC